MSFEEQIISKDKCPVIYFPNGGYRVCCPSNLLRNPRSFENWGISRIFTILIFGHVTCVD